HARHPSPAFPTRRSSDLFSRSGLHPALAEDYLPTDQPAKLVAGVHVPAWVDPRAVAVDEYLCDAARVCRPLAALFDFVDVARIEDRKSTRLNSSHLGISY